MKTGITSIEKVYNTKGSFPVLVLCSDLEFYVVKYTRDLYAVNLFNEYIGSAFLKLWKLGTPDYDFIKVKREDVPLGLHSNIQPSYFNTTCFGTKFSKNYSDITNFLTNSPKRWIDQFLCKEEILMIALFDIWLSNEDRSFNNPNLMYDLSNYNRFVPIDHQYLFNSSNLAYGLLQLTSNESILYHPLIQKLFKNDEINNTALN